MYDSAVPPSLQAIDRARHLLKRLVEAGQSDILKARLAPDMFECGVQLRMVASFALRATYPLTGQSVPEFIDGPGDAESLDALLALSDKHVRAFSVDSFEGAETRIMRHVAGDAKLEQSGHAYLTLFALPNLWFHLSMAFAIARLKGVAVGKADYDGWHLYEPGFSFVTP